LLSFVIDVKWLRLPIGKLLFPLNCLGAIDKLCLSKCRTDFSLVFMAARGVPDHTQPAILPDHLRSPNIDLRLPITEKLPLVQQPNLSVKN
jgi:hypothetical protein